MSAVDVREIARWDVTGLRRAVAGLDAAGDGLPGWRAMLEEATQQLAAGGLWSGPGGRAAAAGLAEVAGAAAVAHAGLAGSLWDLDRLVVQAAAAQDAAEQAMALAPFVGADAAGGMTGHPRGTVTDAQRAAFAERYETLTDTALRHAAQAADAAADATAAVPVAGHLAPLATGRGVPLAGPSAAHPDVPRVPTDAAPDAAAAWWSGLSAAGQMAVIARAPRALGALPGVPAWARDRANRALLSCALSRGDGAARETAAVVATQVAAREATGQVVQVLELDLDEGLAAVALGDLDTADATGVLVPGTGNTVADDLDALLTDAAAVGAAAEAAAAPGAAVATVAWLGYRTPPSVPAAGSSDRARTGGRSLDTTLDGLAAARTATGTPRARVLVVGHSYGAVVIDEAADAPGRLAADAVAVLGDPGMDGPGWTLEVDEAYRALAAWDPIRLTPDLVHGSSWGTDDQGYEELPTELGMFHSDYYDPDHPTVAALGRLLVEGD